MSPELAYIYDDFANNRTVITFADREIYKPLGKGVDEGCYINTSSSEKANYEARPMKLCYFPITFEEDQNNYKLSVKKSDIGINDDAGLKIEMRHTFANENNSNDKKYEVTNQTIDSGATYFYAPEAVSAYINAIAVSKWYANESGLNRNFYTNSGDRSLNIEKGDLIVGIDSNYLTDNAYSVPNLICVCAKEYYNYTFGASLDVIAHELMLFR